MHHYEIPVDHNVEESLNSSRNEMEEQPQKIIFSSRNSPPFFGGLKLCNQIGATHWFLP